MSQPYYEIFLPGDSEPTRQNVEVISAIERTPDLNTTCEVYQEVELESALTKCIGNC